MRTKGGFVFWVFNVHNPHEHGNPSGFQGDIAEQMIDKWYPETTIFIKLNFYRVLKITTNGRLIKKKPSRIGPPPYLGGGFLFTFSFSV